MINIVTALPAEARPLREHLGLRHKQPNAAFPVYRNDNMALIVSGPGKVAAAAATAVLAGNDPEATKNAWLNIGIAGHAQHDIGSAFIAHRITDQANGSSWYPPQTLDLCLPTENLLTVDQPGEDYPRDALCDMEASGFFPVACRFSTSELVQSLKIVSDNTTQPATAITAKLCSRLVADRIDDIEQLLTALDRLATEYSQWHAPHPGLAQLAERWHFSVSQQHQLQQLGRRWQALAAGEALWIEQLQHKTSATEVLQCLQQHLDTLAAGS